MPTSVAKVALVIAMIGTAAACSKSPTSPSAATTKTVSSVTVGGDTSVSAGATTQLSATAQYSDQTSEVVTSQATWTSSDPSVATVSAAGVLNALRVGTVDVSATYRGVAGRRTMPVNAARFGLEIALVRFTVLGTCDDAAQDALTSDLAGRGEFATQVRTVLADGRSTTIHETDDYPGDPVGRLFAHHLARNESTSLAGLDKALHVLSGVAGQFVRVEFRATEWDQEIVVFPPSLRFVRDPAMNNRLDSRTHGYSDNGWTNLGDNSITLGTSANCRTRLDYTVTAARQ